MFSVDKTSYGMKIILGGHIKEDEMKEWFQKAKGIVEKMLSKFCVFVDMRELQPLPAESQKYVIDLQKICQEKNVERTVVVLNNAVTTMQFKRIAKDTGIYSYERYIDASTTPNWESVGMSWLNGAVDPDA